MEEDEGAAGRLVRHSAQDEKEPPLVLVDGTELMADKAREREVKEVGNSGYKRIYLIGTGSRTTFVEVGNSGHKRTRFGQRGITRDSLSV